MSRAFVKESDILPPDEPPEFEIGYGPNLMTQEGLDRIVARLAEIDTQLAANPDAETRSRLARDLRYWTARKANAQVFTSANPEEVEFGSQVTIRRNGRTQQFQLVGEDEANPAAGRINWQSPLAKAILGLRAGDVGTLGERVPADEIEVVEIVPLAQPSQ